MNSRPNLPLPNGNRTTPRPSAGGPSPAELLAKMPRKPLNPEQQLAALDKVQAQATQRIKLGQQLFKAAEARLTQQQDVLDKIRNQQQDLRDQVQEDVAKSLQTYDQWMGKIDESFTTAIREVTERLGRLEVEQQNTREEMQAMVARASALMEQTQRLLMDAFGDQAELAEMVDDQEAFEQIEPTALESAIAGQYAGQYAEQYDEEYIEDESDAVPMVDAPAAIPLMLHEEVMEIDEQEDVFGQVLKRLRDADAEQDAEDQAAA